MVPFRDEASHAALPHNHSAFTAPRRRCVGAMNRAIALFAIATLALASGRAAAESCDVLTQEKTRITREMTDLVAKYPGTHLVITMCAAGASNDYQHSKDESASVGEFAGCAVIGCALVGFQNCVDISEQWFRLGLRLSDVDDRLRQSHC